MSPAPELPAHDPIAALADRCVQCGLCLPACPTYTRDRLEAESPRGRIALARALARGDIEPTPVTEAHLDHCLGCRSCEAVCPAGVEYGQLLMQARTRQRERRPTGRWQRWAEALVARPEQLARLLRLYRTGFPLLPAALRRLPRPPATAGALPARDRPSALPPVALFTGCIARSYESPVQTALVRLLGTLGLDLTVPPAQTCCGSLHAHGGNPAGAQSLAAANRAAFAGHAAVLTLASGCHENVAAAMPDGSEAIDALAFLHRHRDRLRFHCLDTRIALHLPCTQRNVVGSAPILRDLLARVPGLEVVELGHGCCGAAGIRMLADPARAVGYRQPLLDTLHASGVTQLLSANIGCRLHLAGGTTLPVRHPLELLAAQVATGDEA